MSLPLTLTDGQLPSSAGTLLAGSTVGAVKLAGTFQNTGGSTETISLSLSRNGGTSRKILRVALATNETLIVNGLSIESNDTLLGISTDASVVDYVLSQGSGAFEVKVLDATGALRQVNSGISGNQTVSGNQAVTGTLAVTGATTLTGAATITQENAVTGASTAAAGTTTANATALPAGTARVYPTTAADDAKGVIIDVADKVTNRLLMIGNGVSNKILKVYPPSGGTINGASADAAFSSASGKGVIILCLSSASNTWLAW